MSFQIVVQCYINHTFPPFTNLAKEAMLEGRSPIIIDNTNVEAWEMKPYVKMVGVAPLNSIWPQCYPK